MQQAYAKAAEVLSYETDTGLFRWKVSRGKCKAGQIAGTRHSEGYVQINTGGKILLAHRLAWFIVHGRLPEPMVDHRNGVRNDNRIDNLREADHSMNGQNQRSAQKGNKSGVLGVHQRKDTGKWYANIARRGESMSFGPFDSKNKAARAYANAKRWFHPYAPTEASTCSAS